MSLLSVHDLLPLLATPVALATLGAGLLALARAQALLARRRARRARARLAAQSGAVARAASTTPAP